MAKAHIAFWQGELKMLLLVDHVSDLDFQHKMTWSFLFNGLRWEVTVHFVNIGRNVYHHCLNLLFLIIDFEICYYLWTIIHHNSYVLWSIQGLCIISNFFGLLLRSKLLLKAGVHDSVKVFWSPSCIWLIQLRNMSVSQMNQDLFTLS